MPLRPHRLVPVAALAAALALAACGSSSSDEPGTAAASEEEKQLAFVDCLRSRGLDVQAGADGRGGLMMRSQVERGSAPSDQTTGGDDDRAFKACREETGWEPRPPSEEQQAEMRDRALRFAECMRDEGVDMPDPQTDGGRVMMRVRADTPGFRAAAEKCGGGMAVPAAPAAP